MIRSFRKDLIIVVITRMIKILGRTTVFVLHDADRPFRESPKIHPICCAIGWNDATAAGFT